jgi:hypothetical protein
MQENPYRVMAANVKTDAWAASMATGRIVEGAAMGIDEGNGEGIL